MRLNPFNPGSVNVRRGGGGGRGGFPGGGGGKIGCGTLVIALIGAVVFGVDPMQTIGIVEGTQTAAPARQVSNESTAEICDDNSYSVESCNALGSLNETWQPLFQQAGVSFSQPTLTFLDGGTENTGCGMASSAMGPFYCPADQGIYIDTAFYDQLSREMGAQGDFARYYVMAHEYGHHVQNLTGMADQIRSAQSQQPQAANQLQVRMELQADCYAGVWAGRNRNLIEPGDLEEGLTAASAIGDDTLQRSAGRRVNPESFTHGSSEQRMRWLQVGLRTGDEDQCDTFADLRQ